MGTVSTAKWILSLKISNGESYGHANVSTSTACSLCVLCARALLLSHKYYVTGCPISITYVSVCWRWPVVWFSQLSTQGAWLQFGFKASQTIYDSMNRWDEDLKETISLHESRHCLLGLWKKFESTANCERSRGRRGNWNTPITVFMETGLTNWSNQFIHLVIFLYPISVRHAISICRWLMFKTVQVDKRVYVSNALWNQNTKHGEAIFILARQISAKIA